jgi:hypothetical protein
MVILACTTLVVSGCARHRLTLPEAERAAWWFEDFAHGVDRDWRELIYDDMSDGLRRLAAFARGGATPGGEPRPPQPFGRRAVRWELLHRALADGQLAIDAEGILHLARGLDGDVAAILKPEVDQENLDRLYGAEVLLRASGLRADGRRADELVALLHRVQVHHALAVGGQEWHDDSTSSSANAATPSTSAPGSSRKPGG